MERRQKWILGGGGVSAVTGMAIIGLDATGRYFTAKSIMDIIPSLEINWLPIYVFIWSAGLVAMIMVLCELIADRRKKEDRASVIAQNREFHLNFMTLPQALNVMTGYSYGDLRNGSRHAEKSYNSAVEQISLAAQNNTLQLRGKNSLTHEVEIISASIFTSGGVFFYTQSPDKLLIGMTYSLSGANIYDEIYIRASDVKRLKNPVESK